MFYYAFFCVEFDLSFNCLGKLFLALTLNHCLDHYGLEKLDLEVDLDFDAYLRTTHYPYLVNPQTSFWNGLGMSLCMVPPCC